MKNIAAIYHDKKLLAAAFMIIAAIGFGISFMLFNGKKSVAEPGCDGICVALQQEGASPSAVTVENGSYVQFNSADGKAHSLSLGGGGEEHNHHGQFSSGEFRADEAWRVRFDKDGTYKFHDHFNPKINVVVLVYTPDKDYKIEQ